MSYELVVPGQFRGEIAIDSDTDPQHRPRGRMARLQEMSGDFPTIEQVVERILDGYPLMFDMGLQRTGDSH